MMPRKLSAVVVCVGRAEHLRQTLMHNWGQVDEIVVVTDAEDEKTFWTVMGRDGEPVEKIKLVKSIRHADRDFAFNKGAMLNDGLKALAPDADWVVLTDADCFLPDNLREYVRTHALNPGVLYGAYRRNKEELKSDGTGTVLHHPVNREPNGYFQLFNRRASAIRDRWPAVMSEEFCSAGGVDSWFLQQFLAGKRHVIPELAVRHIDHGGELGAGWNGEATGPRWRQLGMLTPRGLIVTGKLPNDWESRNLRFVDTLRGKSWEGKLENAAEATNSNGTVRTFLGEDIGTHHIHVSTWG